VLREHRVTPVGVLLRQFRNRLKKTPGDSNGCLHAVGPAKAVTNGPGSPHAEVF
jgi:hypothetical protein